MHKCCSIRYSLLREFLAEEFSTYILLVFGLSSVAQYVFMKENNPHDASFLSVNLSFGFAVTLGILIAGSISGAHMNPAVSLVSVTNIGSNQADL